MKFKAPKGVATVSVGGDTYNVGRGGIVEIPDEKQGIVGMLAPHGVVPVSDDKPAADSDETDKTDKPASVATDATGE